MRKSHHSLHGLLRRSLLRSVVCMILPVCVLAGLLVVLTQRYGADIALTTRASEVRTVLVQDLPDEVWNVVSGRISFEDGRQRMLIDSALWELNDAGQCRRGRGTVPQRGAARHPHDRQLR